MLPATFYSTIAAGTRALLAEENRLRKLSSNGDPSPQDIGVIEELESRYADSPYRDGAVLRELREALNWYIEQD